MRERFEGVIALAAPVLDLLLAAGDRLSRSVGPEDEYYPIRPPGEAFELSPVARSDQAEGAPAPVELEPGARSSPPEPRA